MLISIIFIIITLVTAVIITLAQKYFAIKEDPVVDNIDKLLPQTQCGQCGYPGCLPYAKAVAEGDEINKCVPGGQELVVQLAELLNREIPADELEEPQDLIAVIDEETCIGCLHCIEACPVDAIIGSKKLMHVIVPDYCTGCELCIPPCPVKCISMIERPKHLFAFDKLARHTNMPSNVKPEQLITAVNVPVNERQDDTHTATYSPKKSNLLSVFGNKSQNLSKLSKFTSLGKDKSNKTIQELNDNSGQEDLLKPLDLSSSSNDSTRESTINDTVNQDNFNYLDPKLGNTQPSYVTPLVQRLAQRLSEHKNNENN